MASGAKALLFILLIPFLTALGHDVYFSYLSDEDKVKQVKRMQIDPDDFKISDLGWIWKEYHEDSMEMVHDNVENQAWDEKVNPILQLPTMVVASVPFFLGCIYYLLAFFLGVWPFSRHGMMRSTPSDDFAVYKHAKSKSIKYSKK